VDLEQLAKWLDESADWLQNFVPGDKKYQPRYRAAVAAIRELIDKRSLGPGEEDRADRSLEAATDALLAKCGEKS